MTPADQHKSERITTEKSCLGINEPQCCLLNLMGSRPHPNQPCPSQMRKLFPPLHRRSKPNPLAPCSGLYQHFWPGWEPGGFFLVCTSWAPLSGFAPFWPLDLDWGQAGGVPHPGDDSALPEAFPLLLRHADWFPNAGLGLARGHGFFDSLLSIKYMEGCAPFPHAQRHSGRNPNLRTLAPRGTHSRRRMRPGRRSSRVAPNLPRGTAHRVGMELSSASSVRDTLPLRHGAQGGYVERGLERFRDGLYVPAA